MYTYKYKYKYIYIIIMNADSLDNAKCSFVLC